MLKQCVINMNYEISSQQYKAYSSFLWRKKKKTAHSLKKSNSISQYSQAVLEGKFIINSSIWETLLSILQLSA